VAAIVWASATALSAQSAGTLQIVPPDRTEIWESDFVPGQISENFIRLNVIRVGGTAGEVTVDFVPSGGTATSGTDYDIFPAARVFFRDGFAGPQSVIFVPRPDFEYEGDETAILSLSNPTGGATIGAPSSVTFVIHDTSAGKPGAVIVPTLQPGVLAVLAAAIAVAGMLILSRRT